MAALRRLLSRIVFEAVVAWPRWATDWPPGYRLWLRLLPIAGEHVGREWLKALGEPPDSLTEGRQ